MADKIGKSYQVNYDKGKKERKLQALKSAKGKEEKKALEKGWGNIIH